jgi:hypothetical protein
MLVRLGELEMNALTQGLLLIGVWAASGALAYVMWRLAVARPIAPARILVRLDPPRRTRTPRR